MSPRRAFLRGLAVSVHGNSQAFGYSITITATYGAVSAERGNPSPIEVVAFALAAVAAFSGLNLLVHQALPEQPSSERQRVLLVATATDFLAVGVAVALGLLLGHLLPDRAVWWVTPLTCSLLYVAIQALELAVGRAGSDAADD